MSVKVSNWVWEHSRATGTRRLVLLAIADHCADDGTGSYPSIDKLARKCNMTVRAIYDNLRALAEASELEIKSKGSEYGTNLYTVQMLHSANPRRVSAGSTVQKRDGDLHVNKNQPSVKPSGTKEASSSVAQNDASFEQFWKRYPSQPNNTKPDKRLAREQWQKLKPPERNLALAAVENYRVACQDGIAKHAHRWLRHHTFEDYQQPPTNRTPPTNKNRGINEMWGRTG